MCACICTSVESHRNELQLREKLFELPWTFLGGEKICWRVLSFLNWGQIHADAHTHSPPRSGWVGWQLPCWDPWWWRMQSSNFSELYNWGYKIYHSTSCQDTLGFCFIMRRVVLLSSDLDELLEQLHSLVERYAHEHLRHDPLLDLVAALEEDRERGCVTSSGRMAECVVRQFLLHMEREEKKTP